MSVLSQAIEEWNPYSDGTKNLPRTCVGCGRQSAELGGWVWRWQRPTPGHPGRHTDSLCGPCFNPIRKILSQQPRCLRCRSTKLVEDTIAGGRLRRTTCEICAWHREDPVQ